MLVEMINRFCHLDYESIFIEVTNVRPSLTNVSSLELFIGIPDKDLNEYILNLRNIRGKLKIEKKGI